MRSSTKFTRTNFSSVFPLIILTLSVHSATEARVIRRQRSEAVQSDAALWTLVEQQAAAIQVLEAKVATLERGQTNVQNLQTAVQELSGNFKRTSQAVGFTVRFSDDPVHMTNHGILKPSNVITNDGQGYDLKSGAFTAPVSGLYAFYLKVMTTSAQQPTGLVIKRGQDQVQGQALTYVWVNGLNNQGASEVTVHLGEGEKVWVEHDEGWPSIRGGAWTVFVGYLLQADL